MCLQKILSLSLSHSLLVQKIASLFSLLSLSLYFLSSSRIRSKEEFTTFQGWNKKSGCINVKQKSG